MSRRTFIELLQDPHVPIGDLIFSAGVGQVDAPMFDGLPSHRWNWLADILTNPQWGLTAMLPRMTGLCESAAQLCRTTAGPVHPVGLEKEWQEHSAEFRKHGPRFRAPGEPEAVGVLEDIAVDGHDHCRGSETSSFEALLGYASVTWAIHGSGARDVLLLASSSWEAARVARGRLRQAS